jgi:HD-like signal output (HDOD) protein
VPKLRCDLTASDIAELADHLDRQVAKVCLSTDPSVAAKILDLNADPDAGFAQYARIIQNDPALSGKLLKLANSAHYAQRKPITTVERACVLVGLERLRSLSLGFYLSRSTADSTSELSRTVWGRSVFRACLAAELARVTAPILTSEAFCVGLLLDAGVSLMPRLVGDSYERIVPATLSPASMFAREFRELEFTHVDVAAALARSWKLPDTLSKPIEWHHTTPGKSERIEPVHKLHRVAYCVGMIDCPSTPPPPGEMLPIPAEAHGILRCDPAQIENAVHRGVEEYAITIDVFSDVAAGINDLEALAQRAHSQLTAALEVAVVPMPRTGLSPIERFTIGGSLVEARRQLSDTVVAYLCNNEGQQLAQVSFTLGGADVHAIREALGLVPNDDNAIASMIESLRRRVA